MRRLIVSALGAVALEVVVLYSTRVTENWKWLSTLPAILGPVGILVGIVVAYNVSALASDRISRLLKAAILCNPAATAVFGGAAAMFGTKERFFVEAVASMAIALLAFAAGVALFLAYVLRRVRHGVTIT